MSDDNAIVKQDDKMLESLLLEGDLSKLNPQQRVQYYQKVCQSVGLNPLTKPFSYIRLNNKLTLYALKDATDQLRKIHEVSIDDVDIKEVESQFIVKVKGHDKTGRSDVELGVVNKSDMGGNTANAQMKAVTKAKRRLTLSLCGLGWLDETEVETIKDAAPVAVDENGEIKDQYQISYEDASQVIVHIKDKDHKLSDMTKNQLEWVINNSPSFNVIESAKVVLKHDFQMEQA